MYHVLEYIYEVLSRSSANFALKNNHIQQQLVSINSSKVVLLNDNLAFHNN